MTQQEYERLPNGTTLYFVCVGYQSGEAEIEYVKKGDMPNQELQCGIFSTTKQGAIASAIENYTKQVAYHTTALSSVTELMKKYI